MTGVNLGTLFAKLLLEDDFSATFQKYLSEQDKAAKKTQQVADGFKVAGAAIAAVGIATVGAANQMNKSMANIATLIPDNTERILELKGAVQGMAIEFGKSTDDISGGLYELISTLGDSADNAKILEINVKAASAGLSSTQDAINFTTAVTKTYGDTTAAAFEKVSDLGFQAVNLGKTTFPELAQSIGRVAPLAKETGVSMEELFAVIATVTGVTGNTSEVMSQMSAAIAAVVSPTKELQDVYQKMGVTSGEALIKQRGLVGALQDIAGAAKQANIPLIDLVGRKEAWVIASSLAGEQAENFTQKLKAMGNVAGATDTAFRQQTQGIAASAHQWNQWKATLEVAAQKVGDAILNNLPGPLATVAVGFSEMGGSAIASAGQLAQVAIAAKMLGGANIIGNIGAAANAVTGLTGAASLARLGLIAVGVAIAAWSFAKVYEAISLLNELRIQSNNLAKDQAVQAEKTGDIIETVRRKTGQTVGSLEDALRVLNQYNRGLTGQAATVTEEYKKQFAGWQRGKADADALGLAGANLARTQTAIADETKKANGEFNPFAKQLAATNAEVKSYTVTQKAAIAAGTALGRNAEEIANEWNKIPGAARMSTAAVQKFMSAAKDTTKETSKLNDELADLRKQFSGESLATKVRQTADALGDLSTITKREWDQLAPQFEEAIDKMVQRGEQQTPEFKRISELWLKAIGAGMQAPTGIENDQFFRNLFGEEKFNAYKPFLTNTLQTVFGRAVQDLTGPPAKDLGKFFEGLGEATKVGGAQWAPNFLSGLTATLGSAQFGQQLGQALIGALQHGGGAKQVGQSIGGMIGNTIGTQIGASVASSIGGVAGGLIGNAVIPVLGGLVGAWLGGYIGSLFGGSSEEAMAAKQMRDQLLEKIGGPEALEQFQRQGQLVSSAFFKGIRSPGAMGISDADMNTLLTTEDPEELQRVWDKIQPIVNAVQKTFEGLNTAIAGTNRIASGLGNSLQKSMDEQTKAVEAAQKAMLDAMEAADVSSEEISKKQAEFAEANKNRVFAANEEQIGSFNRLATIAGADLVNLAGRTGDLVGALLQLQPAFDVLIEARDKFGLTDQMSAATAQVLHFYETVKNNADVFDTVAGVGQVLTGFGTAMLENTELFNALGGELAAQVGILESRGVATQEVFAMIAPQLQALWEAAQSGKVTIDETTAALLAQAEAQGVVGEAGRDVNERILNVLTEIRDLWGVGIPSAVDQTGQAVERVGRQATTATTQQRNAAQATERAWTQAGDQVATNWGRSQDGMVSRNAEAVERVKTRLKTIPYDFPIKVDWKVPPLELPDPGKLEVPVEFDMPDNGRFPWDEGYQRQDGTTTYPGSTDPYQGAMGTAPGGLMEGGRGQQTIVVERDGQRDLQFTAENLPDYVRIRAGNTVLGV